MTTSLHGLRVGVVCQKSGVIPAAGLLRCLRAAGAQASLLTDQAGTTLRFSRRLLAFEAAEFPWRDEAARFQERVLAHVQQHGLDIVVPSDVETSQLLASLRPPIPLFPLSEPAHYDVLDDKLSYSRLLERLELPAPSTVLVEPDQPLPHDLLSGLSFPVLLKPLRSDGGQGIIRCDSRSELEQQLRRLAGRGELPVLAQQFFAGGVVGVNVFAVKGEVLATTTQFEPGRYVGVVFVEQPALEAAARRICAAVGYTGVANFEFLFDFGSGDWACMECNPRFYRRAWLSMVRGVNFAALGIAYALQGERPVQVRPPLGPVLQFQRSVAGEAPQGPLPGMHLPTRGDVRALCSWLEDPLPTMLYLGGVLRGRLRRGLAGWRGSPPDRTG